MDQHYLLECLRDYPEITFKKYGKRYRLEKIEESVEHVRRENRLTWEDVQRIRESEEWLYDRHWAVPDPEAVRAGLSRVEGRLDFWHYHRKRETLVATLYEVFKNIEVVSVILRFVIPEHFAIYSPPMARILEVRRGLRDTDTYRNYLDNLEAIRRHTKGFSTIAQVNMAVWVLFERVYGVCPDERIREAFDRDLFMQDLRIRNMAHLLDLSDVRLARSLFSVNMRLSAQLGGFCFEQKVRALFQRSMNESPEYVDLKELINRLQGAEVIDGIRAGRWHLLRIVRNDALHTPDRLTEKGVRELLSEIGEEGDGGS
ncbi:MAG: hypothetical protein ACP5OS_06740 [Leptospirillia bacterium]